jgi:predicted nuclease of predicted toxin-antitoxin system
VKFHVDATSSPRVAVGLCDHGHDAVAVRDVGLGDASDDRILDHAIAHQQVIVSEDTDFGTLLAHRGLAAPSLILLRTSDPIDADGQTRLILDNLDAIEDDLAIGAIAVFARGHLRVRPLPLG